MKGLILTAALLVASGSAYAELMQGRSREQETRWCRDDELHEKVRNGCRDSLR